MLDVLAVGYPSADLIMRVSRPAGVGETATILDLPDLDALNPGGCAANIAVGMARLGSRAGLVSAVGDDNASWKYLALLTADGVDISGVASVPGRMPLCLLFVTPQGEHQTFYYPGVNAQKPPDIPAAALSAATKWGVITVGPKEHTSEMARSWHEAGVPILWSLRRDPAAFPPDLVRYLARVSSIAVMNEAEAEMLTTELGLERVEDLLSIGERMEAVLITRGAEGSRVVWQDGEADVPAVPPDRFVDPTGAGDAFCAGVLWGRLRGFSWDRAARIGAVVASFVLEEFGAQAGLPDATSVARRLSKHFGEDLIST